MNSARDGEEAGLVYRQLDIAASRFLGRSLRFHGFVAQDPAVRDAVLGQRPVVEHLPQAPASRCFRVLASRLAGGAGSLSPLRLAHQTPAPHVDSNAPGTEARPCRAIMGGRTN